MSFKDVDKMVGGAIDPSRVVLKSLDPSPDYVLRQSSKKYEEDIAFHNLLRNKAQFEYGNPEVLQQTTDSLADYRPRNNIAFFQYGAGFNRFPEHELVRRVSPLYSGKGSSRDHPKLHQLFMDSFEHHPELVSMYNNN